MSCKGCVYAAALSGEWFCDYLSITGHRRPCPPGEGCTVRVEAEKDPKRKWKECPPVKGRTWDTDRARALYDEGLPDAKIAAEVGTTKSAVAFWRRKQGLQSNKERKKESGASETAEASFSAGSPIQRSLVLPAPAGMVELSIQADGCMISLRAPNLEAAEAIYNCAGGLLKDMAKAVRRRATDETQP